MAIISNATTIADAGAFSASLGAMTHIKTLTASNSANLTFVHGASSVVLDSTYPIYMFKYTNAHPVTNDQPFLFQGTTDGSNFNTTITSTHFEIGGRENGSSPFGPNYQTEQDLAQSTDFQYIQKDFGSENDESGSGTLTLFDPSSTTFVKHFMGEGSNVHDVDIAMHTFQGGYFNTTSAITGIQFKFASGNIDSGKIKLYGIKDS